MSPKSFMATAFRAKRMCFTLALEPMDGRCGLSGAQSGDDTSETEMWKSLCSKHMLAQLGRDCGKPKLLRSRNL